MAGSSSSTEDPGRRRALRWSYAGSIGVLLVGSIVVAAVTGEWGSAVFGGAIIAGVVVAVAFCADGWGYLSRGSSRRITPAERGWLVRSLWLPPVTLLAGVLSGSVTVLAIGAVAMIAAGVFATTVLLRG